MPETGSVSVTPAASGDVEDLVHVMTEAFLDDPFMVMALGDPIGTQPVRARYLHRAAIMSGPLAQGTIDVARDEDCRILGVALWHAPTDKPSLLHHLPHAADYLKAFGPGGLRRALRLGAAFDACRPTARHWYLDTIAVGEAARGQGVGSILLRHRLSQIDLAGEAAYLESTTPQSARLYRRHGFRVMRKVEALADSYAMWRPAQGIEPATG